MTRSFDFTNTAIDALPIPATGRAEYRDSRSPALILRVSASGTKSFCVARKVNGKFLRVTLGTFKTSRDASPRLTAERARVAARRADGEMAEGIDPTAVKKETRKRGRHLSDVLKDYQRVKSGEYAGLSIGFLGESEQSGLLRVFIKAQLLEVSVCRRPVNTGARVSAMKAWAELGSEMELQKFLKSAGMPGRLASKLASVGWLTIERQKDPDPQLLLALRRLANLP